jgi:predicted alpha-1,2-mannosidase
MRGRDSKGAWRTPFSPFALGHDASRRNDFTEGNSWQWTWHVMQDPEGLIAALGGRDKALAKLLALFEQPEKTADSGFVLDATGLIGQYAHGNEPSHHVVYFFQYLGRGDRTAELVREIFDKFYLAKPDGLCGNDDCGQMSAWHVFSAMGFYPFSPCGGEYVLGAPQVASVKLKMENVKCREGNGEFHVIARNLSKENKYVKSVTLNGKPVEGFKLRHADIVAGGELVFEMAARP